MGLKLHIVIHVIWWVNASSHGYNVLPWWSSH